MSWRVMQAMDDDFRSMQRAVHFEIKKWPRARAVGRHWEPGAISMTAAVAWPCFARESCAPSVTAAGMAIAMGQRGSAGGLAP